MIRLARLQVKRRVEDSSSLKPEPGQFVEAETRRGIEVAIADLEEHAEIDEVVLRRAHYTEEQVLGDWFPGAAKITRITMTRSGATFPGRAPY